jgi:hypothetical protein
MTDNWRGDLQGKLETLIDEFAVRGISHSDVCSAVVEAVGKLKNAQERDPDPTDDVAIEEPANDWPAADQSRPIE